MPFDLTIPDWIGIIGSLVIAAAYFAVSSGKVDAKNPTFQILNLVGAIMILFSLYYRPNPGAIVIELIWIGISVYALISFAWAKSSDETD